MTVADYMSEVLTASYRGANRGYYIEGDPLGQQGDFITAPEISQIFGELLGLWLVNSWMEAGCPAKIILAELGPGRGTLMSDALRAARVMPAFIRAADIHLVEVSPSLRIIQSQALRDFSVTWHNSFSEIPDEQPVFLVANEFFDALPIHQFEKSPRGWCERLITLRNDRLTFTLGQPSALIERTLTQQQQHAQSGTVLEYCPAGLALVEEISHRIKQSGGAAIIIDYGYEAPPGTGTLQAVKKHKFTLLSTHREPQICPHWSTFPHLSMQPSTSRLKARPLRASSLRLWAFENAPKHWAKMPHHRKKTLSNQPLNVSLRPTKWDNCSRS